MISPQVGEWTGRGLAVLGGERGQLADIAAFEQPSMFAAFALPASLG